MFTDNKLATCEKNPTRSGIFISFGPIPPASLPLGPGVCTADLQK